MKQSLRTYLFLCFICSLSLGLWRPAHASQAPAAYTITGPAAVAVGETFSIFIGASSAQEAMNAVSGSIQYPQNLLTVSQVSLKNSRIIYWQQQPSADPRTGHISFVGGLPTPGYQGPNGLLFTLRATATAEGTITIGTRPGSIILANDKQGTILPTAPGSLTITSRIPSPSTPQPPTPSAPPVDTAPPIQLELAVGRDKHLFDNQWFAAFTAIDTESGIDHYEIAQITASQTLPLPEQWIVTGSPYVLPHQQQRGFVFLKAVDKSGNQTLASVPFHPCRIMPWWIIALIGGYAILCVCIAQRKRTTRSTYKNTPRETQHIQKI